MNLRKIVISTALLIASGLAFAGNGMGHPAQQSGNDNGQAMGASGMSGCGMSVEQETNLHQHMQMMRSQMSEIMQTTDPARRQALMQQQIDSMDRMLHDMENAHGAHAMMSQGQMMHDGMAMHNPDTN